MAAPVSESSVSRLARSAAGSDDNAAAGPPVPTAVDAAVAAVAMSASRFEEHGEPEPVELAQLRRKLDDLGSQQRKSHTAVQQLADSVAALVTAHRRRVRWLNLNSFVAYVIFTVLLGTAFYMMYLRRAGALGVELGALTEQRAAAVKRADAASAELAVGKDRSQKALEVFQLYGEGKAAEAEVKHAALRGTLTPLEDAALGSVRERAAKASFDKAYGEGLAAYRAGNFAAAVTPFEAAVAAGPAVGAKLGSAQYYLGLCLARTGELPRAKAAFEAALAAQVEIEDARYQLAMVLDRAGEVGKARTEYEKFATGHPKMILAVYAMRRSAVLARWGRAAPPLPGTAPLPQAAPGLGAPGVPAGQGGLPAPAGAGAAAGAGAVRKWPAKKWAPAGAAPTAPAAAPGAAAPPSAPPAETSPVPDPAPPASGS
jgi:tetratricopeptide (TPR) repeat protein